LNVQWIDIEKITPYWRNPRRRSADSIRKIADSIASFGWQQPLVVDKSNVLIIGHGRLEAAKLLEAKQVPVVVAGNLTTEKVKALRLADNRVNRESDWDLEQLAAEIEELRSLDIDLALTGFSADDVKRIADDLDVAQLEKIAGSADDPEPEDVTAEGGSDSSSSGGGDEGDGAQVTFSEVMSLRQRAVCNQAVKAYMKKHRIERRGDALFSILEESLEESGA
jgi:ParB-like chromosome segregation protein Spo0J